MIKEKKLDNEIMSLFLLEQKLGKQSSSVKSYLYC